MAIARFAEVCPELPDRIIGRLALGPRQLEERFGITGGHIFHGEMLPGQLLEQRPDRRRFGGIENLYLAGSGAHPGGAVTGRAGPAGRPRGARGPLMARVYVTRDLPGGALDRLRERHDVEVWDGDDQPPADELARQVGGGRGAAEHAGRPGRRGAAGRGAAACGPWPTTPSAWTTWTWTRPPSAASRWATPRRAHRRHRRHGAGADAGGHAPPARGRGAGARRALDLVGPGRAAGP